MQLNSQLPELSCSTFAVPVYRWQKDAAEEFLHEFFKPSASGFGVLEEMSLAVRDLLRDHRINPSCGQSPNGVLSLSYGLAACTLDIAAVDVNSGYMKGASLLGGGEQAARNSAGPGGGFSRT
jgi:hypothetical protein